MRRKNNGQDKYFEFETKKSLPKKAILVTKFAELSFSEYSHPLSTFYKYYKRYIEGKLRESKKDIFNSIEVVYCKEDGFNYVIKTVKK